MQSQLKVDGPVTVWVTKWALTKGVLKMRAEILDEGLAKGASKGYRRVFHHGEWHRTAVEAGRRVQVMIAAKRKSLVGATKRLDALASDFDRGVCPCITIEDYEVSA